MSGQAVEAASLRGSLRIMRRELRLRALRCTHVARMRISGAFPFYFYRK